MERQPKPTSKSIDHLRQRVAALAQLLDETMHDIQTVEAEFEQEEESVRTRITQQLEARSNLQLNAAVQAVRSELVAERALLSQEIEELKKAKADWEKEKLQLVAEVRRANQMLDQSKEDYNRALAEVEEAAAIALDRQMATAVDRMRLESTAASGAQRPGTDFQTLHAEIARVEELIRQTAKAIEDPETELSVVIRQNAERASLESYLRGVRFALPTNR